MRLGSLVVMVSFVLAASVGMAAVDINSAPVADLTTLDGVNEELAGAIVREREENGPFTSVEDLARVPSMTADLIGRLKARAAVGSGTALGDNRARMAAEVTRVLKKFDREPTIQQVQKEAVEHARANPSVIDSWRVRARLRGLAPEFRLRTVLDADRDYQWTQSVTPPTGQAPILPPEPSPTTPRRDEWENNGNVQAWGIWRLDRLIFDPEEPRVNREAVRLAKHMDQVLDDATRRYFERRRLQVEMEINPPTDVSDRLRKEIRLQELTADLDGMTGGWFSSQLRSP
jgi:competence ComEA-like helix-hairpin-helix protein